MPTPEAELRPLLALRALPGLGDLGQKALLEEFDGAAQAWSKGRREWETVLQARLSAYDREAAFAEADRAAAELARLRAEAIDLTCPDYPPALLHLYDPPGAIFVRGRLELLEAPIVAIVGARACTSYGAEAARLLSAQLTQAGWVVASGMARGIDGAAHEAALAAGGATLAVLGSGLAVAYPPEHRALQDEIARRGLLVSEFLPDELPRPHNFPRRNRVMAGLARGVVVVEAGAKSGALVTANHALELGRPVFAVPGPITSPAHAGSNGLLRDGATVVLGVEEILHGLAEAPWDPARRPQVTAARARGKRSARTASGGPSEAAAEPEPPGLAPPERRLWRALDGDPRHVDDVCGRSGLAAADALVALSNLEMRGLALRAAGGLWQRPPRRPEPPGPTGQP